LYISALIVVQKINSFTLFRPSFSTLYLRKKIKIPAEKSWREWKKR